MARRYQDGLPSHEARPMMYPQVYPEGLQGLPHGDMLPPVRMGGGQMTTADRLRALADQMDAMRDGGPRDADPHALAVMRPPPEQVPRFAQDLPPDAHRYGPPPGSLDNMQEHGVPHERYSGPPMRGRPAAVEPRPERGDTGNPDHNKLPQPVYVHRQQIRWLLKMRLKQMRNAIAALEAAGCQRERTARARMPKPLASVHMPRIAPDYETVFGRKTDYTSLGCTKLSDFLRNECPDFLNAPGTMIDQVCTEISIAKSNPTPGESNAAKRTGESSVIRRGHPLVTPDTTPGQAAFLLKTLSVIGYATADVAPTLSTKAEFARVFPSEAADRADDKKDAAAGAKAAQERPAKTGAAKSSREQPEAAKAGVEKKELASAKRRRQRAAKSGKGGGAGGDGGDTPVTASGEEEQQDAANAVVAGAAADGEEPAPAAKRPKVQAEEASLTREASVGEEGAGGVAAGDDAMPDGDADMDTADVEEAAADDGGDASGHGPGFAADASGKTPALRTTALPLSLTSTAEKGDSAHPCPASLSDAERHLVLRLRSEVFERLFRDCCVPHYYKQLAAGDSKATEGFSMPPKAAVEIQRFSLAEDEKALLGPNITKTLLDRPRFPALGRKRLPAADVTPLLDLAGSDGSAEGTSERDERLLALAALPMMLRRVITGDVGDSEAEAGPCRLVAVSMGVEWLPDRHLAVQRLRQAALVATLDAVPSAHALLRAADKGGGGEVLVAAATGAVPSALALPCDVVLSRMKKLVTLDHLPKLLEATGTPSLSDFLGSSHVADLVAPVDTSESAPLLRPLLDPSRTLRAVLERRAIDAADAQSLCLGPEPVYRTLSVLREHWALFGVLFRPEFLGCADVPAALGTQPDLVTLVAAPAARLTQWPCARPTVATLLRHLLLQALEAAAGAPAAAAVPAASDAAAAVASADAPVGGGLDADADTSVGAAEAAAVEARTGQGMDGVAGAPAASEADTTLASMSVSGEARVDAGESGGDESVAAETTSADAVATGGDADLRDGVDATAGVPVSVTIGLDALSSAFEGAYHVSTPVEELSAALDSLAWQFDVERLETPEGGDGELLRVSLKPQTEPPSAPATRERGRLLWSFLERAYVHGDQETLGSVRLSAKKRSRKAKAATGAAATAAAKPTAESAAKVELLPAERPAKRVANENTRGGGAAKQPVKGSATGTTTAAKRGAVPASSGTTRAPAPAPQAAAAARRRPQRAPRAGGEPRRAPTGSAPAPVDRARERMMHPPPDRVNMHRSQAPAGRRPLDASPRRRPEPQRPLPMRSSSGVRGGYREPPPDAGLYGPPGGPGPSRSPVQQPRPRYGGPPERDFPPSRSISHSSRMSADYYPPTRAAERADPYCAPPAAYDAYDRGPAPGPSMQQQQRFEPPVDYIPPGSVYSSQGRGGGPDPIDHGPIYPQSGAPIPQRAYGNGGAREDPYAIADAYAPVATSAGGDLMYERGGGGGGLGREGYSGGYEDEYAPAVLPRRDAYGGGRDVPGLQPDAYGGRAPGSSAYNGRGGGGGSGYEGPLQYASQAGGSGRGAEPGRVYQQQGGGGGSFVVQEQGGYREPLPHPSHTRAVYALGDGGGQSYYYIN